MSLNSRIIRDFLLGGLGSECIELGELIAERNTGMDGELVIKKRTEVATGRRMDSDVVIEELDRRDGQECNRTELWKMKKKMI